MGLTWTVGLLHAAAVEVLRWLGGYTITREGEPSSNDFHRCSVDFDGVTEVARTFTGRDFNIANAWTLSFWVKPITGIATDDWMFLLWNGAGFPNYIRIRTDATTASTMEVVIYSSAGAIIKDYRFANFFTADVWANIVVSWDGTNLKGYRNGVEDASPTKSTDNSGTQTNTTRDLSIGNNWAGTKGFKSRIHSCAIWNEALTADEVKAIYNHGDGASFNLQRNQDGYASKANLKHWWRLGYDVATIGENFATASEPLNNNVGLFSADIFRDAPDGGYVDYDGSTEYHRKGTGGGGGGSGTVTLGVANTYTLAAWFRLDALPGAAAYMTVFDANKGDTGAVNKDRILIDVDGTNARFRVFAGDSTGAGQVVTGATSAARAGEWVHVALRKDGTTRQSIYVNGEEVGFTAASIATQTDAARIVGVAADPTLLASKLDGQIHSVAMWNVALSAAELKEIYNGGFKEFDLAADTTTYTKSSNLKHWWKVGRPAQSGETGDNTITDDVASGAVDLSVNAAGLTHADDVKTGSGVAQGVCVDTNGSNEWFQNSTEQSIGIANAWSISFWVNKESLPSSGYPCTISFEKSTVNGDSAILIDTEAAVSSTELRVVLLNTAGTVTKLYKWNSFFSAGVWVHIVVTWDGTNLKLYKDGQALSASSKPTDSATTQQDATRTVNVNVRADDSQPTQNGKMAYIGVWNEALFANECAQIYTMGSSFDPRNDVQAYASSANLKHWWKLGENLDDLGKDYVTSGGIDLDANASNITHEDDILGVSA